MSEWIARQPGSNRPETQSAFEVEGCFATRAFNAGLGLHSLADLVGTGLSEQIEAERSRSRRRDTEMLQQGSKLSQTSCRGIIIENSLKWLSCQTLER